MARSAGVWTRRLHKGLKNKTGVPINIQTRRTRKENTFLFFFSFCTTQHDCKGGFCFLTCSPQQCQLIQEHVSLLWPVLFWWILLACMNTRKYQKGLKRFFLTFGDFCYVPRGPFFFWSLWYRSMRVTVIENKKQELASRRRQLLVFLKQVIHQPRS